MQSHLDAEPTLLEASAPIAAALGKRALLLLLALATLASLGCDDPQPGSSDAGGLPPLEVPEDGEPTDPLPTSAYLLVGASAEVHVGNKSYSFSGYTPSVWAALLEENPNHATNYIATCGILLSSDDKLIVNASFYKYENRSAYDSFSLADDGTSTVIWGMNDISAAEEWSAGGSENSVSLTAFRGQRSLVVSIAFEGTATENFTSERSAASSVVTCYYGLNL